MHVLTDPDRIAEFCNRLRDETYITVDTEFVPERTYWPQLCLIQIAGRNEVSAIDPLADGIDLQPVFDLLADKAVLKVFHAGRMDLEIFYKLAGELPRIVFDTQIAAMACGLGDQVSYARIVQKIAGKTIGKDSRITDWSKRPLSNRQIAYALEDVTHLRTVYESLVSTLASKQRNGWIEDRMAALNDPESYRNDVNEAWKRIKKKPRKPRDLAILRELAAWREHLAQARNVPRKRIIQDEALVAIALQRPQTDEALERVRLVPRGMANGSWGRQILKAVKRGMASSNEELPQPETESGSSDRVPAPLADLIRTLINARCEELGIAPRLIANSDEIQKFAADAAVANPLASGWRYELLGRDIERLREGKLALSVDDGALRLIRV